MRDKSHNEQIERWAEYVRNNPDKWKSKVSPFIDAQFLMTQRFHSNLAKTEEGREILKNLREARIQKPSR
ncbi:MAG: hypothetical protein PHH00_03800 [Candidatus Nanoarchaeia archaeon]|nr:hypothetical protein [Candidatus Nanoarchaeia archaeon]